MGNTFLKNFVSVYDYDQQEVRLGVNIHAEKLAKAYPFKKGDFKRWHKHFILYNWYI